MNKILLAAPNSAYKNYCFKEWAMLAKLFSEKYGCDIFVVDNTIGDLNKSLYKKHKINYSWVNPKGKSSFEYICESQNKIRNKVLKDRYTHLFFLETDLFPPLSVLPLMECLDKQVVTMPYFLYSGYSTILMNQEVRIFGDDALVRNYSLSESFSFFNGETRECFSSGFGCSLIKREVLEKITFRCTPDPWSNAGFGANAHADSYFYTDLQRAKMQPYMYTGHVIRHYNSDWSKHQVALGRN